jgi:hypothetical protein
MNGKGRSRICRRCCVGERKNIFMKDDIPRDIVTASFTMITFIALMKSAIA